MRKSISIVAMAAVLTALSAATAVAQNYPPPANPSLRPAPPPLRLEIRPRLRVQYYRDCVDFYAIEPRASGPTVVPRSNCRWAKRYYAY
jgi:hypothetical protein